MKLIDWILEIISGAILIGSLILILFTYHNLPDNIPVHFNFLGEPDKFGQKSTIIYFFLICSCLYFFVTFLNFRPHNFNYPVKITEENQNIQYALSTRMLRWIKLFINILFCHAILNMLFSKHYFLKDNNLIIPFFILCIFIIIIYSYKQMLKSK